MQVNTTRFGSVNAAAEDTLHFPDGVIGFPELKQWALLPAGGDDARFKWLQSLDDGSVAFLIVNPAHFFPDYAVEQSEDQVRKLELTCEDDALVVCIVTAGLGKCTLNLKGPLVLNSKTRVGCQVVLPDAEYGTRHPIDRKQVARAMPVLP